MCQNKVGIEYVAVDEVHYRNLVLIASQLNRSVDEVLDFFFSGLIELRFTPDGGCGFTFKIDFD